MNNEFKKILLKLVKLSRTDQRWILNQLTPCQRAHFEQLQGTALLKDAYKFRHLTYSWPTSTPDTPALPTVCQKLSQEEPLFIAIILEQGQFAWEEIFLHQCQHQVQIEEQYHTQVPQLKPATKYYVFQQWQQQLSFSEQLETAHG